MSSYCNGQARANWKFPRHLHKAFDATVAALGAAVKTISNEALSTFNSIGQGQSHSYLHRKTSRARSESIPPSSNTSSDASGDCPSVYTWTVEGTQQCHRSCE